MNNVKPMSGPSTGRARPAASTRYSNSSPPSRSATAAHRVDDRPVARLAADERGDGERDGEARGATALVPVRHGRERGRELEQLVRPARVRDAERRAIHHRPVARAHLGTALLDVLAGGVRGALGRAGEHDPREVPDVGRIASGATRRDARARRPCRAAPRSTSERVRFRAMAVSSVVMPGGRPIHASSNAGRGSGIWARASELERRPEGIAERETEHASDGSLAEVHDDASSQLGCIVAGHERRTFGTLGDRMDKIGPKHKMCRRVGEPLCGRPNCPSNKRPYPPGQHGRGRKRISEYQTRLVEKQKLRAIYGVSEAQMRRYYEKASNSMDVTGEEMIRQLETRLDTVILRLGFALTTRQARQLVSHGHVKLDGKRINVPSARVKAEQTIELRPRRRTSSRSARRWRSCPTPRLPLPEQGRRARRRFPAMPDRDEIRSRPRSRNA